MKKDLFDCEISYIKCFCDSYEEPDVFRFRNSLLPDMYDYNFTYVKDHLDSQRMLELINRELSLRSAENQSFCKILFNYPIGDMLTAMNAPEPELSRSGVYILRADLYQELEENEDCYIKKIDSQKTADDKLQYDLLSRGKQGDDLCRRRSIFQSKVFLNDGGVDGYICYHDGVPVGACELYFHENVAKIEDFSVLPQERRKKFGTSILKHLITLAHESKAQTIYLVADEDDTVKDMYRKFGFEKADEMTEIFFML